MLFEKALNAKEKQEIADNLEALNLELNRYIISKSQNGDFNYKVGEYIENAVNDKVFNKEDAFDKQETSAYVKMAKKYIYLVEKESNGNIKITYNRKISGNSVDLTDAVLAMNLEWITKENNWTSTFPMTNRPDVVGEVTKTGTYGFKTSNGTLIAENKGISSSYTTADSYIKIDLSGYTSDYTADLTINAKFSGYYSSYGWLVVTENENAIGYYSSSYLKDTVTNTKISKTSSNVMMYANGNYSTWNTNKDYTYTFDGGKCYYLHFGYYRYSSYSTYGDDTLTINNISLKEKRKVPQITLSTETQGVNLQYMVENKDGQIVTDWTDGDKILTINDNGTERYLTYGDIIYGQMKAGENTSAISQINIQDGEAPVIEITATNTYSDEITVTVNNVKDNCGLPETVLYDYYITEDGNDYPVKSDNSEPTKSTSYTFTGLKQKQTYKIKVVTHDAWENEGYAETTITTVAVPQGAIINVDWNEGEPSVYITVRNSSYSHYKIQYQVNTTNKDGWKDTSSGSYLTDVAYGDTVYVRLIDNSGNISQASSTTIIDETNPTVELYYNGDSMISSEGGVAAFSYNMYDYESGLDLSSCRWMVSENYIDSKDSFEYNGRTFSSESGMENEIIYSSQYNYSTMIYISILAVDYKGNYTIENLSYTLQSDKPVIGDGVIYNPDGGQWRFEAYDFDTNNQNPTVPCQIVINDGYSIGLCGTTELGLNSGSGTILFDSTSSSGIYSPASTCLSSLFSYNSEGIMASPLDLNYFAIVGDIDNIISEQGSVTLDNYLQDYNGVLNYLKSVSGYVTYMGTVYINNYGTITKISDDTSIGLPMIFYISISESQIHGSRPSFYIGNNYNNY